MKLHTALEKVIWTIVVVTGSILWTLVLSSAWAQGGGPSGSYIPASGEGRVGAAGLFWYLLLYGSTIATTIGAVLFVVRPLSVILEGLVEPLVARSFCVLLSALMFAAGSISGVGISSSLGSYNIDSEEHLGEWLSQFSTRISTSFVTMGSILAVVLFSSLILHVSLARAKLERNRA